MARRADGSAGDADYGRIGAGYTNFRQPEPVIAQRIEEMLGSAHSILNVGAGAGSYEPRGQNLTAVEPSASMRAQRPAELPQAIDATAEALPFADDSFDAAMASFTIHQWRDLEQGLSEMRRVTRGPIVILSCDPQRVCDFWLNDYAPDVLATEARRYPSLERITETLGHTTQALPVPIPLHCRDGFNEAYFGRPEMLLLEGARQANSAWSFVAPDIVSTAVAALKAAIESGAWDTRHGHLRDQPFYDGSLRLFVAQG
ncbi:ubiquinone biosynthesis protein [Bosea sp. WAO]|uniref:class I SAM-dependent methyltransferase n=1 Tax=Bosea sp. WAO TaxID=406341 RepID=UPI000748745A|nr:class I SAM-dependent methyltransferase [Bosea sp. WAO]KUL92617.1 ubiquinone biosynthesis protein [Bosea sp. WAO]